MTYDVRGCGAVRYEKHGRSREKHQSRRQTQRNNVNFLDTMYRKYGKQSFYKWRPEERGKECSRSWLDLARREEPLKAAREQAGLDFRSFFLWRRGVG